MEKETAIEIGCPICNDTGCQTCLSSEEFAERMSKEIEDKNEKDETEDDENKDADKSAKETVKKDKIEDDGLSFDCDICQDKGCPECGGGA